MTDIVTDRVCLYGVGVGPGDPELLTLKAARIISQAEWLAYPVDKEGKSFARRIASGVISEAAGELPFHVPMTPERAPARAAYDDAAAAIAAKLDGGDSVAVLCEGDPFFYGSFMYLFARLSARFPTGIIPGVTSLTASAARLGRPLAARNEVLKVIPATLEESALRTALEGIESAAIIKIGRHFDKVRGVLSGLGLAGSAAIVESATLAEERITPLEDIPAGARPYFSTILVYAGAEAW